MTDTRSRHPVRLAGLPSAGLRSPGGFRFACHTGMCLVRTERVRHRVLQTPVIRYRHRKTGRVVTLVATVHMGEAAYYQRLHAIVTEMEAAGALVHYEWVNSAATGEWATASSTEHAAWRVWNEGGRDDAQAACRYLGWVPQGAALTYSPSWRNMDMTDLEVVRQARPQNLLDHGEIRSDIRAGMTQDQWDAFLGAGMALVARLLFFDWPRLLRNSSLVGGASRHVWRVTVEDRNSRALASLPPSGNAVLLWGGGHLPGLAAGLKKAGYQRQATTWVNVGELPTIWAGIRAIRTMWKALSASDNDAGVSPPGEPPQPGAGLASGDIGDSPVSRPG